MSFQELVDKVKNFKNKINSMLQEVGVALDKANETLTEPYTYETAPDWVKKLPKDAKDGWIKAFNAAYKEYSGDESKAFAVANSTLNKMGYKKKGDNWVKEAGQATTDEFANATPKEILTELLTDIDAFLNKAEEGIKGKLGSPAIRQFLKEVKNKMKGMIQNIKETDLREAAETIINRIEKFEESSYKGSFEDIRDKVQTALNLSGFFPEKVNDKYIGNAWIRYMFNDKIIVGYASKLYEITYTIKGDVVTLGKPKEVEETYAVKEAELREAVWDTAYINDLPDSSFAYIEAGGKKDVDGKTEPRSLRHLPYKDKGGKVDLPHLRNALARLPQTSISDAAKKSAADKLNAAAKEAKIGQYNKESFEIIREARDEDIEVSNFVSLKEAKFDETLGEVEVVLIEAGTNLDKRRHYPVSTIQEAAPGFKGLKMYINHPTATEEKERPERNLRDWASTITESRFENGKAIGKVSVHDTWLRERLQDPVARAQIGLSINTGGKIAIGKINGQEVQIVEQIVFKRKNGPVSVDWVTEPGARGRVNRLLESRWEEKKMLETVNLKELKEARPDLVESILKESETDTSKKLVQTEKDLKEAQDKIAGFEKSDKLSKQKDTVETILKEAKIPEPSKDRIKEQFATSLVEGDLKEAVKKETEKELGYINKLSSKGKIKISGTTEKDIKESLQEDLDKRAGVEDKKKEGEE